MTDDIDVVDRLRIAWTSMTDEANDEREEAADEIERLRKRIERLEWESQRLNDEINRWVQGRVEVVMDSDELRALIDSLRVDGTCRVQLKQLFTLAANHRGRHEDEEDDDD